MRLLGAVKTSSPLLLAWKKDTRRRRCISSPLFPNCFDRPMPQMSSESDSPLLLVCVCVCCCDLRQSDGGETKRKEGGERGNLGIPIWPTDLSSLLTSLLLPSACLWLRGMVHVIFSQVRIFQPRRPKEERAQHVNCLSHEGSAVFIVADVAKTKGNQESGVAGKYESKLTQKEKSLGDYQSPPFPQFLLAAKDLKTPQTLDGSVIKAPKLQSRSCHAISAIRDRK